RWLVTCLMFFGLPFLLVAYGLGTVWEIQRSEARDRLFSRLDEYLLTIRKFDNTVEFFDDFFHRCLRRLRKIDEDNSRGKSRAYLKLVLWNLHRRFPGVFQTTMVTEKGEPDPRYSPTAAPKLIVRRLVETIREMQFSPRGDYSTTRELVWPLIRGYIGPVAEVGKFDAFRQRLIEANTDAKNRWFFYLISRSSGLLAHISQTPDWDIIPARDRMRRLRRQVRDPEVKFGLITLDRQSQLRGTLALAIGEHERTLSDHVEVGRHLVSVMPYASKARIWASIPTDRLPNFLWHRLCLLAIGSLVFGLFSWLAYRFIVLETTFRFTMRNRLILLFGFASGLPLMVLGFYGWDYLHDKFRTRIREAHDIADRNLQILDGRFPLQRGIMERLCQRIGHQVEAQLLHGHAVDMNRLDRLSRRLGRAEFLLIDVKGRIRSSSDARKEHRSANSQMRKLFGIVAKSVLKQIDKEGSHQITSSEMLVSSVPGIDLALNPLLKGLGSITPINFADFHVWVYFLPIRGASGNIEYLFSATWDKFGLENYFLQTHLTGINRHRPDTRFFGFHTASEKLYPEWKSRPQQLLNFMTNLRRQQGTTTETLVWRGRNYLLTGIKPKELSQFFLLAIENADPIENEIKHLRLRLSLFTIIAVVFSLGLGLTLSRQFLTPLATLTQGVVAIQERQFRHRVPSLGENELGDLALTFNRVMEGLSDLEVARIVQESLFPAAEIHIGPYRASGRSVSASELGGDYFDMQKLSDDRLLILIGDVSGHGVPAALVMAMAKAFIEYQCSLSTIPTPDQLLAGLHLVLFRTLKRRRTMTCFLGLLDTTTHQLTYANAGHNYPFLFRRGEPARNLTLPSFPLGSRQNISVKTAEELLVSGDHLLLYTDGFIEAQTEGDSIGYQRVAEEVPLLFTDDPSASIDRILTWHKRLSQDITQADDITLVILSRAP
ncbi:MAG TPA: SpoIIE family protein phosphatase, partial [Candidatus Ozemobacteraceae bacterium]|nr:SpoIIE family protein phosphatase [Candidatus Ozemobacteraceae bacterium]